MTLEDFDEWVAEHASSGGLCKAIRAALVRLADEDRRDRILFAASMMEAMVARDPEQASISHAFDLAEEMLQEAKRREGSND